MRELMARRVNLLGAATIAAALLLWEAAIHVGLLTFTYLPPPSDIANGFSELLSTGELQENLWHTLSAAVSGWLMAAVIGVSAGALLGLFRPLWRYSMASVEALRALPVVAFVPIAVLLYGFTKEMEIVVACYAAVWPILLNTFAGMRGLDTRLREVGHVLGLGRAAAFWKLQLPAATPAIMVGLRLGLSISVVLTLVAEMVGNPAGLGFALVQAGQALQPEQMFAYVVVIGVSGIVLNTVLMAIARGVFRGQMAAAGDAA
ncbi:ABC transporter permease [Streptomyces sp. MP131-18]|uniref:ABC transporter permease n=1 Tax=Streptomyces sp. MP131-18 TaxID=1857892 RepID=UPI0009A21693|nr:ABC transporter permease [Streptomyces sp. MP131-18]ONK14332.1 putative aliphatic sulfonates transport permeaseprotein SsuC [Streptomyces sp. MP131-18]